MCAISPITGAAGGPSPSPGSVAITTPCSSSAASPQARLAELVDEHPGELELVVGRGHAVERVRPVGLRIDADIAREAVEQRLGELLGELGGERSIHARSVTRRGPEPGSSAATRVAKRHGHRTCTRLLRSADAAPGRPPVDDRAGPSLRPRRPRRDRARSHAPRASRRARRSRSEQRHRADQAPRLMAGAAPRPPRLGAGHACDARTAQARACTRVRRGRGFSYLDARRAAAPRSRRDPAAEGAGDPARMAGGVDLQRSPGASAGHRSRRGRAASSTSITRAGASSRTAGSSITCSSSPSACRSSAGGCCARCAPRRSSTASACSPARCGCSMSACSGMGTEEYAEEEGGVGLATVDQGQRHPARGRDRVRLRRQERVAPAAGGPG